MPEGLRFGETGIGAADVDRQVLGSHTDEVYDRAFLSPGAGVGVGTTDVQVLGRGAEVSLPNGATSTYAWAFPVRQSWRNHYLRFTVYYTDVTGSALDFGVTLSSWAKGGSAAVVGLQIGTATIALPSNAAAGTYLTYSSQFSSAAITSAQHQIATFVLSRDGAGDANPNSLVVLGVMVEAYRA